ncbi:hypothetical protein PPUJ20066_40920 [Pseudomonas putida]|nr:hypothetical protein PPUJ20066_40920 [Pseudomonas putida]
MQWDRAVACGIHQTDVQCFAIRLGRAERQAESAICVDQSGTYHSACGVAHLNRGAWFTATSKGHAFNQGQISRLCWWQQVLRGDRARLRNVTRGIGQGHLQGAAIDHGRIQGQQEGAICTHSASRQHIAVGITHLNRSPRFASASQLVASETDDQINRRVRRCGIAAVDIRCGDGAGKRSVASGIGCGGLQNFAINLGRVEVDAEHAGRADQCAAKFSAVGGENTNGATRFGAAGNDGAVGADGQFTRCGRRGDVRRGDLCGQRRQAGVIDGDDIEQFAVGLWWREFKGEGAVGTGNGAADQGAIGIVHFHAAARWRGTGQGGAIGIDGQVAWAGGGGGLRYVVFEGNRSVAAWVGLHQAQLLAWLGSRVEIDQEGAIGQDGAGTDHIAVGIAHFHGGPGFAATAQYQTSRADNDVADGIRRSNVRCVELQWCRAVASGIHQTNI